jgi:hypothetical protein
MGLASSLESDERALRLLSSKLAPVTGPTEIIHTQLYRCRKQIHDYLEPRTGVYERVLGMWPPRNTLSRRTLEAAPVELQSLRRRAQDALSLAESISASRQILSELGQHQADQPGIWDALVVQRGLAERLERASRLEEAMALHGEIAVIAETLSRNRNALVLLANNLKHSASDSLLSAAESLEAHVRTASATFQDSVKQVISTARLAVRGAADRQLRHLGRRGSTKRSKSASYSQHHVHEDLRYRLLLHRAGKKFAKRQHKNAALDL